MAAKTQKTKKRKKRKIFISHHHLDDKMSEWMADIIHSKGCRTFISQRDISVGQNICKKIRKALRKSDELAALITPSGLSSQWVHDEMLSFWLQEKPRIVILYGVTKKKAIEKYQHLLEDSKIITIDEIDTYFEEL